jgi:N utilization substance protein B
MGSRSAARESALQMLYAAEYGHHLPDVLITDFWREFPGDAAVRGVLADRTRIDEQLIKASANWRLERMNPIARNVLRLGTWELLSRLDVPRAVIIDESVEVAKRYGGTETAGFVNGVLDRIADSCGRKNEPRGAGVSAAPEPDESEDDDDDDDIAEGAPPTSEDEAKGEP